MWKKNKDKKEDKKPKAYKNLIDYFYLFGVDPDIINHERFDKEQSFLQKGYLSPELLSRFPPNDKSDINVDLKIIKNHCFPNGFTLVVKNGIPVEEYFYFSLDNTVSTDSNDKKINYSCVLFYEPLTKYVRIKNLMNKYRVKENSELKIKVIKPEYKIDNMYVPKCLCISSFLSFPDEFKLLLSKLLNYQKSDKITVPIEKIIENMIYGIPRPPRAYFDIICKKNNGLFPKQDFEMNIHLPELNQYDINSFKFQSIFNFSIDDILDIYKSLLLEAPVLFFCTKKELLTNIFESFMTLLHPFEYQNPHVSILPDMNAGIIEMSKSFAFGINHEWIVPGNKKKQTYFQKFNLNIINKKILICDIDNHKIYKYYNCNPSQHIINFNDLGNYSDSDETDPMNMRSKDINNDCFNDWNEYYLPDHYTKKLKKKLKAYIDKNLNMNTVEYNAKTNKELGEQTFYYYLASIFQTYNDFIYNTKEDVNRICCELLTKDLKDINVETLFNVKGFISANNKDNGFFMKFFETNIFKEFIKRKYLFKDCDRYSILCFDEAISAKKNKKWFSKKIKTDFKDCKFLKVSKSYVIKQTKDFSKDEYKFIEEHKETLIKYYQQYKKDALSYIIFPRFLYDNTFFEKPFCTTLYYENELCYMIEDSKKAIDKVQNPNIFSIYNSEFAKIYLFDFKNYNAPNEIENSLYLLWLNIFCLTLHYCDEKEKEYRYEEMMDHLSRITLERTRIINIIVSALGQYGDDKMMIRFFEQLNPFYYSSYSYLSCKFQNEKKIVNDLKKMNIANTRLSINYYRESKMGLNIFDIINSNTVKTLKPRTFDLKTDPSSNPKLNPNEPTTETVVFDDMITCEKCKKKVEIGIITIAFNRMNKDKLLKCPECNNFFSPVLNVQYGKNTDKITLYSVYYLYELSNELIKTYGNRISMDELRNKYKDFFWNCIWYFGLKGLSYDMILKYKFINYYSVGKDQNYKRCFNNLEFQRQPLPD